MFVEMREEKIIKILKKYYAKKKLIELLKKIENILIN